MRSRRRSCSSPPTRDAPPPAIARLIGFDLVSVKPGEARVEFQATDANANPMGTLHGGILCDIADAAMGIAYSSNLGEGESFMTRCESTSGVFRPEIEELT